MEPLNTDNRAFSLIEVLLAITLFAMFSVGTFYVAADTIQQDARVQLDTEALQYAQEGIEATRNIRDRSYLALTNGDHGLNFTSDIWSFVQAPEIVDGFYNRTITISDVYRDSSGNITGIGDFDPETKHVESKVEWTWKGALPRSVRLETYLTNWSADDWIQTTCTEFNGGTLDGVEVEASPAPPADNCLIELEFIEAPSSFYTSADIGEHGNDVVVDGNYAYVATSKTNTGLTIVDLSDAENPMIISQLDISGKGRTITKDGNYVYMGVEKSTEGLAIVNVENPTGPILTKSFNVGGYGNQPVVSGNTLYMGVNADEGFISVDITDKSNPSQLDSLEIDDEEVKVVHLNGNHAYLGSSEDDEGLTVVDISNPSSLNIVTSLDVGEEVNAIEISGAFAFLGTEESNDSLIVVNISNPAGPSVVTSMDVGGEIQDLVMLGTYLYAAVDDNEAGLAVINIENPAAPTLSYNFDLNGKGTGIDTAGSYVYITLDVNNRGLVIVETLSPSLATSGNYASSISDTGSDTTRYNFIEWDHASVPGGTVRFQIRTADSVANMTSATWVGSDGTNATYYENSRTAISLDPSRTGQRYSQFKAFIDSDGATTPTIESVRINYNP